MAFMHNLFEGFARPKKKTMEYTYGFDFFRVFRGQKHWMFVQQDPTS